MMYDKKTLEREAETLATLEIQCCLMSEDERRLSGELVTARNKKTLEGGVSTKEIKRQLELVRKEISSLRIQIQNQTEKCRKIRVQIPEIQDKEYWWDVPPECGAWDGFSIPGGFFMESGLLETETDEKGYRMIQDTYTSAAVSLLEFYGKREDGFIPLYFSKKKFRMMLNRPLKRRIIYNVSVSSGAYHFAAKLNTQSSPAAAIRAQFAQREAYLKGELEREIDAYNQRIDDWERLEHLSFMTNEERWMIGAMDTEEYFHENVWRNWGEEDKREKVRRQLETERYHAEQAVMEAQRSYQASYKALSEDTDILRVMAAGEAVYGDGELLALILYCGEQSVKEYRFAGKMNPETLEGPLTGEEILFRKNPISMELLTHISQTYGSFLPMYQVLKARPRNCPDAVWRAWAQLRWSWVLGSMPSGK